MLFGSQLLGLGGLSYLQPCLQPENVPSMQALQSKNALALVLMTKSSSRVGMSTDVGCRTCYWYLFEFSRRSRACVQICRTFDSSYGDLEPTQEEPTQINQDY